MTLIVRAQIWPLKGPLQQPIRTAFGEMRTRPALLLSLTDENGNIGWGESWVNFPEWAVYERVSVLHHLLHNLLGQELSWQSLQDLYQTYRIQAIQWGGLGPFSQAISAIEMALLDLESKAQARSLREHLGRLPPSSGGKGIRLKQDGGLGKHSSLTQTTILPTAPVTQLTSVKIPVYASGIGPENVEARVALAAQSGFQYAKVKVGFDESLDHNNFTSAVKILGEERVMVDANQSWSLNEATNQLAYFAYSGALWIEEPISSLDYAGYESLTQTYSCIAGGENWYLESLDSLKNVNLSVFQPDLCKIGGFWAADVAVNTMGNNENRIAFHVLGTPLCHAFALQVAAAWGDRVAFVEFDTNENPFLRSFDGLWHIADGCAVLNDTMGLGISVDTEQLQSFVIREMLPFCFLGAP